MTQSPPLRGAPARAQVICLAGFMGSGKTTVGTLLARQLAWHFVDLDERIEQTAGLAIPQIFERFGEQSFRQIEADQLRAALGRASELKEATVLALGGGTYAQPGCPEFLRNAGVPVLWLDSPIELLLSRCMTMTGRPLFRDEIELSRTPCAAASLVSTGGSSCGQLRRSHSGRRGNPRPRHCGGRWQRSTSRRRKTKFLTSLR